MCQLPTGPPRLCCQIQCIGMIPQVHCTADAAPALTVSIAMFAYHCAALAALEVRECAVTALSVMACMCCVLVALYTGRGCLAVQHLWRLAGLASTHPSAVQLRGWLMTTSRCNCVRAPGFAGRPAVDSWLLVYCLFRNGGLNVC